MIIFAFQVKVFFFNKMWQQKKKRIPPPPLMLKIIPLQLWDVGTNNFLENIAHLHNTYVCDHT